MITNFEFRDKIHDWRLEMVNFSEFNLLVGLSGVGKTQIINTLNRVRNVGLNTLYANGCQWTLSLQIDDKQYEWIAETSVVQENLDNQSKYEIKMRNRKPKEPEFLYEKITCNGKVLAEQTEATFRFEDTTLPKINNIESLIWLFSKQDKIRFIYQALARINFFDENEDAAKHHLAINERMPKSLPSYYSSLDDLRAEMINVPLSYKIYVLQECFPEDYQRIKDDYIDIFNTVEDVKLSLASDVDPPFLRDILSVEDNTSSNEDAVILSIREKGVSHWVTASRMSSGMLRTFVHLFELALAPPDSVIVIDDFENSLGVNCLPAVVDHFLDRKRDIQFILTSHHPYVIHNIPMEWWKIVTRKGSTVTVSDKSAFPTLDTESRHNRFDLLRNLEEYREGLQ